MPLEDFVKSAHTTRGVADLIALSSGAIKAFFDARGIPLEPEAVNSILMFAPMFIQTCVGAYVGLNESLVDYTDEKPFVYAIRPALWGAVFGASETLMGYSIMYTLSSLMS